MLRLPSDENFNRDIVRGLLRRAEGLDLVGVQDVGLIGAEDPVILAWAAENNRILLTHDRATVPAFAYERVQAGDAMPGVIVVDDRAAIGTVIDDVLLFALCSDEGECEGKSCFCKPACVPPKRNAPQITTNRRRKPPSQVCVPERVRGFVSGWQLTRRRPLPVAT